MWDLIVHFESPFFSIILYDEQLIFILILS